MASKHLFSNLSTGAAGDVETAPHQKILNARTEHTYTSAQMLPQRNPITRDSVHFSFPLYAMDKLKTRKIFLQTSWWCLQSITVCFKRFSGNVSSLEKGKKQLSLAAVSNNIMIWFLSGELSLWNNKQNQVGIGSGTIVKHFLILLHPWSRLSITISWTEIEFLKTLQINKKGDVEIEYLDSNADIIINISIRIIIIGVRFDALSFPGLFC